jgi:hypothetical protein
MGAKSRASALSPAFWSRVVVQLGGDGTGRTGRAKTGARRVPAICEDETNRSRRKPVLLLLLPPNPPRGILPMPAADTAGWRETAVGVMLTGPKNPFGLSRCGRGGGRVKDVGKGEAPTTALCSRGVRRLSELRVAGAAAAVGKGRSLCASCDCLPVPRERKAMGEGGRRKGGDEQRNARAAGARLPTLLLRALMSRIEDRGAGQRSRH